MEKANLKIKIASRERVIIAPIHYLFGTTRKFSAKSKGKCWIKLPKNKRPAARGAQNNDNNDKEQKQK